MTALALLVLCLQGPNLDAETGFQGTVFSQSWAPVTVTVIHEGDPADAELRVIVRSPSWEPVVYRRPFPLARKTRMRVAIDVFFTGQESDVDVELVAKDQVLRKTAVQPRFVWGAEHRLLTVGPLPEVLVDGLAKEPKVSVARTTPDLLPSSPLPLRALETIVFPAPVDLSTGQEDALREWVERGGRLVVFAGRSTHLRQHPLWREWCPLADPRLESVPVPGSKTDETLTMVRGTLRRGTAFQSLGSDPVAIRAPQGTGEIVFVAPPTDQTAFRRLFPGRFFAPSLLDLPPPPPEEPKGRRPAIGKAFPAPPRLIVQELDEVTKALLPWESPRRAVTLKWGFGLAVLYLLLIGPVEYVCLKRTGKLRLGWLPFAGAVLVFSPLVLFWGGAYSPRASKLVLLELWDERGVQTFGVLRPYVGGRYRLETQSTLSPNPPPLPFAGRDPAPTVTVEAPSTAVLDAAPATTRLISASRPPRTGEAAVSAAWADRGRKRLTVSNPTPIPLRNCQVVTKAAVWAVGDLAAGETREVELQGGQALSTCLGPGLAERRPEYRGVRGWAVAPSLAGLALTVHEAFHAERGDRDRHVLVVRGLDRSRELERGGALFVGSFDRDVAGARIEPAVEMTVAGWVRVRVREAQP